MVDNPAQPARHPRIALAHDWLVGMRGGERVLDAIARTLAPDHDLASLYTMFDDGRGLSDALDRIPKRVAWLGRLPGATRTRRWLLPSYPAAVGALSRRLARDHAGSPIDLLISTSSAAIKGLRAPPGVPHLCYCHTPARYLWSQTDQYAGGLRGLGLAAFGGMLRRWDRRTAANVTCFLANSTHTAAEIKRCYGREARVVFPPVRSELFTPGEAGVAWFRLGRAMPDVQAPATLSDHGASGLATQGRGHATHDATDEFGDTGQASMAPQSRNHATPSTQDFWLAVGALEPYKRFDLAIDAARLADARLMIVGTGSDETRLRGRAGPHVQFLGRVDDSQLRDLFRRCRLLVFPQVEDFGIVAVEAQACGCPVLARRAGGALDTVVDGVTGALFDDPTPASIAAASARVPARSDATTAACRAHAERFSEAAFATAFRVAVARALVPSGSPCGS